MHFRKSWLTPVWVKAAVDSNAGDATAATYFYRLPCDATLKGCTVIPNDTLTAHDSNFATVSLKVGDGAGGTPTAVASRTTKTTSGGGTGNWAVGVTFGLTLTSATTVVKKGQVLCFDIAKAASGVAVPPCVIQVRLWPRDGK